MNWNLFLTDVLLFYKVSLVIIKIAPTTFKRKRILRKGQLAMLMTAWTWFYKKKTF